MRPYLDSRDRSFLSRSVCGNPVEVAEVARAHLARDANLDKRKYTDRRTLDIAVDAAKIKALNLPGRKASLLDKRSNYTGPKIYIKRLDPILTSVAKINALKHKEELEKLQKEQLA